MWVVTTEPVNKHFVNFTSELYKLSIDWLYVGTRPVTEDTSIRLIFAL